MLTMETARKIGVNACIDKLGRNFVLKYRESSTASYTTEADENGNVFCFVGVDNNPASRKHDPDVLILDGTSKYPYYVSCNVNLNTEKVEFVDVAIPA